MTRRFQISADRIGPRRWCWVAIHPDIAHFHAAAARTAPHHDRGWWNGCLGCFQPVWYREREIDGEWVGRWPANGYAGVLRLIDGHVTAEIVAHELVHAAVQVYRMNVRPDVRLGDSCGPREEDLAYIYGELYASLEPQLQEVTMSGTKPNSGTPKDGRLKGRGAKPGPKKGSHNTKK